jgi:hypothetical protein
MIQLVQKKNVLYLFINFFIVEHILFSNFGHFLFSGHEPIFFIENKEKTLRASYDRGTQIFDYMD